MSLSRSRVSGWSILVVGRLALCGVFSGLFLLDPAATLTTTSAQVTGLVAAYSFDEGTGATVADASGNGNNGTISSATWTPSGKFGAALSFNGTNSRVTIPDSSSLDLTNAMTLEAWVMPSVVPAGWSSVVDKDVDRYYLMAGTNQNRPSVGGTFGTTNQNVFGTAALPAGSWTHLAATYDRTTIRLYVNGVQVATGAQTAAVSTSNAVLTIGANFYGEYFAGLIDEVRIYNRALTATEIQSDMATSATPGPRLTITQPANGSTIASSTIAVTYTASGDLAGVDHVHFQLDGNPEVMDLTFDGAYQFTNVPAGSHTLVGHLVRADHSAIPNTTSSVGFTTTQPDVVPPTVSITAPTSGATISGVVTIAANAADDGQVVGVQFKLDGANVGAEKTTPPYAVPMNTTTYSNGPHSLTAVARDLGGNATTSVAVSFTISNTNPNDPARIGQWSASFNWPIVAVHAILLPTGKVLSWTDHTDGTGVRLWDPSTNTFRSIPYTGANLFCAGHTFLSDGRLLVVGGHAGTYVGISNSTIFDPSSETWVASGFMTYARWYPTATTLGDGRVMTFSGAINCPSCLIPNDPHNGLADVAEIYNPTTSSWSQFAGAPYRLPMYPHMFVLPDGRIFASSANEDPIASVVLDLGAQQWNQIGGVLDGGSAAMYTPGKVLKSGSAWNVDYPIGVAAATTYVIDMNAPAPAWRQTPSMAFARTEHTLTLLPDGTVLATGGSGDSNVYDLAPAVYEAESWSPVTETWTTLARMNVPRHYHSTALLLPDARVLVAGSGTFGVDQLSAQIFSPPYLFNGPRPVIASAPTSASLGSTFAVQTPDAARIGSATLISLGAVTHAFNESQRIVPLSIQSGSGSIDVTLPGNPNLAPPGYYMLFLLDTNGVPSVSTMLRVVPVPDFVPPAVSLTSPAAGASLTGTTAVSASASDNVAVAGVQFLLDGAPLGAEIPGPGPTFTFNWNTANTTNGAHTLSAQARDGAGNTALATSRSVTVTNAPSTGLVAAWGFNEGTGTSLTDSSGNGRTGTITGATWTTGRFGQALSFDGNDLVNFGDLDVPGSFSVMAWMQTRSLYSGTCGSLVMKPFDYGFELCSGQLAAKVAAGASAWSAGVAAPMTSADLNAWRHVALTYDGTTLRFYVGGSLISSAAGAHASNNAALIFGRWTPASEFWNGLIDEVRIYSRALSQTEIQTDLATPVGGAPPVNTPPTISALSPQTITEDASTGALAFTVGDGETAAGSLAVSTGSSNATLVPGSNIVLGGTGANRTVTVTPAANQSGTAAITVTVSDGQATASTSLLLTVTAVNDLPTISSLANQTTSIGVAVGPLAVTVGDVETAAASLTLSGGSSNAVLVPVANIVFAGAGSARTVTVTPAAGQTGTATITLTVADGLANASTSFVLTVTAAPTGLVAAWGFNEGTGTTLTDSSGNGRTGTITGATWTTGRYGQALSFDGNDLVTLSDLDLTGAFTVMTWMQTRSLYSGTCGSLVMKALDYGFELCSGQLAAEVAAGPSWSASVAQPMTSADLNVWKHVAMTYDGTTLRLYVGGTLINVAAGAHASNNAALIFGRWTPASEFWNGLIDEVRIYSRALTQTEIQTDLATPVGGAPPVNTPPTISALSPQTITEDAGTGALAFTVGDGETAAGSLTVSTGSSNATLVPASNIVVGGTGANRTVTVTPAANQSGTAAITVTVSDGQATASTSFLLTVTAVNDLPTISSVANQATSAGVAVGPLAVTVGDVETAAASLTLSGGSSNAVLVPVANIVFAGAGSARTVTVTPAAGQTGTATITLTVADGLANASTSFVLTVTAAPTGLVAAWGFNEGTGTTLTDSSGNGRTGTITGATWTTGRYGQALSFDGDDLVTLGDLDLTGAFTVMTWMQTRSFYSGTCGSLVMKARDYGFELCSGQLAAKIAAGSSNWSAAVTQPLTSADLNAWKHVAMTYDGTTLRFYLGGNLVGSAAGDHASKNTDLIFGRWTPASEFWNGLIDEVRIYNRALSQTEIQTNLATPVGNP